MPRPMPLVEPVTIAVRLVFMMDLAADAPEPALTVFIGQCSGLCTATETGADWLR